MVENCSRTLKFSVESILRNDFDVKGTPKDDTGDNGMTNYKVTTSKIELSEEKSRKSATIDSYTIGCSEGINTPLHSQAYYYMCYYTYLLQSQQQNGGCQPRFQWPKIPGLDSFPAKSPSPPVKTPPTTTSCYNNNNNNNNHLNNDGPYFSPVLGLEPYLFINRKIQDGHHIKGGISSAGYNDPIPRMEGRDDDKALQNSPAHTTLYEDQTNEGESSCTSSTWINYPFPRHWPAWIYCTRYSDRPSAGPRIRKSKSHNSHHKSLNQPISNAYSFKSRPMVNTESIRQIPAECMIESGDDKRYEDKRPRTAFTNEQLARLKREFLENRYLTEQRRQNLARDLGLNESQIKIWFQNKRAKIKKALNASALNCTVISSSVAAYISTSEQENLCTYASSKLVNSFNKHEKLCTLRQSDTRECSPATYSHYEQNSQNSWDSVITNQGNFNISHIANLS